MKLPRLTIPKMVGQDTLENGTSRLIDNPEPEVYIAHCDNIAHILANTVFRWNARSKIREYLKLTGANTQ